MQTKYDYFTSGDPRRDIKLLYTYLFQILTFFVLKSGKNMEGRKFWWNLEAEGL